MVDKVDQAWRATHRERKQGVYWIKEMEEDQEEDQMMG